MKTKKFPDEWRKNIVELMYKNKEYVEVCQLSCYLAYELFYETFGECD